MRRLVPRRFERKRRIGRAALRALPDGEAVDALVLDLGQSGVALFVERSPAAAQLVEVGFKVEGPAQRSPLATRDGRVVRSRAYPDGNIVGVAFSRPLDDDEFTLLESSLVPA